MATLPEDDPKSEIFRLLSMVRRRYRYMIAASVICLSLAALFLMFVQPSYTSVVRILLDEDRTSPLATAAEASNSNNVDEYIATQVKMIQSDVIAQRVAESLDLTYDGQLTMEMASVLDAIEPNIGEPAGDAGQAIATVERAPQQRILNALKASASVYRLDESFVVEVGVQSRSAELSQKIAEAYGQAYIDDQVASRLEANRRTASWLQERIEDLRLQSLDAAQAVQRFRAENNIVSTDGQLVSDQQLSGLNTQYVLAQQSAAGAEARYDVFQAAVASGDVNQIVGLFTRLPDLAENSAALQLSNQYTAATDRAAAISRNWGEDNAQAVAIRAEIQRLGSQIISEAQRILGSYGSDSRVAQAQLSALAQGMRTAAGESEVANESLVDQRSLEQRAGSFQALYQSYLQRYQESVQQQSLPINAARVISNAELPEEPVFPNKKVILALSLILGLGIGGVSGLAREFLDSSFRTGRDLTNLGVDFFGYVPAGSSTTGRGPKLVELWRSARRRSRHDAAPALGTSEIGKGQDELGRTLRRMRIALDLRRDNALCIVGISSLRKAEGATTIALTLADLEARMGQRVLLIDGNSPDPTLSHLYAGGQKNGLSDVLQGTRPLRDCLVKLPSGAFLLPIGSGEDASRSVDIATAPNAGEILRALRPDFDLVLVDLPFIDATAETRALALRLDTFVLVLEWGVTDRGTLEDTLRSIPTLRGKILGAVLTKVNLSRLPLYDAG